MASFKIIIEIIKNIHKKQVTVLLAQLLYKFNL